MSYKIIIVGCGATGSNIATFVSQLAISEKKINEIILIDGDIVEEKNFRNQKFTARDVGKNKARVLSNRFAKLGINISYVDRYLKDSNEFIKLINKLSERVILVGSVDNNKARRIMDETFKSDKVKELIYIDTGNGDKDRIGQTVIAAKSNGQIIKPPVSEYYPQILMEEEVKEVKEDYRCSEIEEHPQNLATNILSATTTFLMINNIISFGKIKNYHMKFNAEEMTIVAK